MAMAVPSGSPREFGPLFRTERSRLLDVLHSLGVRDWDRPSPCPGWSVLGLAAHLLGGDLTLLAGHRDGHCGIPAPEGLREQEFIGWLDELQIKWVHAARRLSPRLVTDLLEWTDRQIVEMVSVQDASALTARVSWASAGPVPVWLDQARELSERWIHRQQMLEALGHPSDLRQDLAEPVIDGLRWAWPFRLEAHQRPAGSTVEIGVAGPELACRWHLVADDASWQFRPAPERPVLAELQLTAEQAWRLLSNNLDASVHGEVLRWGESELVETLMRTRAIIGTPK
jgi:uncharacterized protein (TIGR03083 family)